MAMLGAPTMQRRRIIGLRRKAMTYPAGGDDRSPANPAVGRQSVATAIHPVGTCPPLIQRPNRP